MRLSFDSPALAFCPLRIFYRLTDIDEVETPIENTITSFQKLQAIFEAGALEWEQSDDCQRLRNALERIPSSTLNGISKIVAIACSTMAYDEPSCQKPSIAQHAMVLTIRDFLQRKNGSQIRCFAQDPAYTEIDKAVLQSTGITVLDDPRAFLEVDEASFIVSVGPDVPVRQIVIDIARPAAMIWDKVKSPEETFEFWSKLCKIPDIFLDGGPADLEELEGIP